MGQLRQRSLKAWISTSCKLEFARVKGFVSFRNLSGLCRVKRALSECLVLILRNTTHTVTGVYKRIDSEASDRLRP